jgi:hypothetical protein
VRAREVVVSATFAVAVKLRGVDDPSADDPESDKVLAVLGAIASRVTTPGAHLGGGGGYGRADYTGESPDVACLIVQKSLDGSGDLADCTEADRDGVRELLRAHPLVERAYVGALHSGDDADGGEAARVTSALVDAICGVDRG